MLIRQGDFSFIYLGSDEDPLPLPLDGRTTFNIRGDDVHEFQLWFTDGDTTFHWNTADASDCVCTAEFFKIPFADDQGSGFLFWSFPYGEHEAVFTLFLETPSLAYIGSSPNEAGGYFTRYVERPVSAPEAFGLLLLGLLVLPLFTRKHIR